MPLLMRRQNSPSAGLNTSFILDQLDENMTEYVHWLTSLLWSPQDEFVGSEDLFGCFESHDVLHSAVAVQI